MLDLAPAGPSSGGAAASRAVAPGDAVIGAWRVTLCPAAAVTLPGNGGQSLHGFFLSLLARRNPALAERLHDVDGPMPFSLGPFETRDGPADRATLRAGVDYSFRVNLLEKELLAEATAALFEIQTAGAPLALDGVPVRLTAIAAAAAGRPYLSFAAVAAAAAKQREIALEFLSPTAFRVEGVNFVFPLPRLVFSSLLRRWNAYSDRPFPPDLERAFEAVMVSDYHLETVRLSLRGFKWTGFTGSVAYTLPRDLSLSQVLAINCLALFAGYAGVGWKTTMGMGQARRLDDGSALHNRTGGDSPERG